MCKYQANQLKRGKKPKQVSHPYLLNQEKQLRTHKKLCFQTFCHKFYSSDHNPGKTEIDHFLKDVQLPTLSKEQANILNAHLVLEELHKALDKMPQNKSPGFINKHKFKNYY